MTLPAFWIGTSWKMNKTSSEVETYIRHLTAHRHDFDGAQIFLVLPFTHLASASRLLHGTSILLGAQNMHYAAAGEFTGEISAEMLKDVGVDLVEIGHSERRRYFNDDDFTVNKKVLSAIEHELTPLICLGEGRAERDFGAAKETVIRQLKIAFHGVATDEASRVLVAYEPVWAIGRDGTPAEPEQAGEVHSWLREALRALYGASIAQEVRLLYGGSVNADNAAELVATPEVDGLFVGRAGLDPLEFVTLIRRATSARDSFQPKGDRPQASGSAQALR